MRWAAVSSVLFLFLQGCAATPIAESTDPADAETPLEGDEILPPRSRPAVPAEPESEVWAFLKNKYDANRDGAIGKDEYTRGGQSFGRLDRNRDGRLDAKDFARRGRGGMSSARMNAFLAQRTMVRYLQADENAQDLSLAELAQSFARSDADKDGSLSAAEFGELKKRVDADRGTEGRGRVPPAERLYSSLVSSADKDKTGSVSLDELEVFFKARDSNHDGVWTMRGGRRRGAGAQPVTGAPAGETAPDFTLKPTHGGAPVTLSSFAGKRPVALIFGSYT